MTWIANNWLGLAALIVAIVFGIATVGAARRWGNRRAKLQCLSGTTRLLATGEYKDKVKMTFEGQTIEDPHIVTLTLKM